MATEHLEETIKREVQSFSQMIMNPRYSFGSSVLRRTTLNRKAMELFCLIQEKIEDQTELERVDDYALEIAFRKYKRKYASVARLMSEWEPNRRKYIEKLHQLIEDLDTQFKRFSFLKLVMSSVEVSGTVLGEILLDSESGWDKKALQLAYSFGICGTFYSTLELGQTKQILHWASVFVEKDRAHLEQFVQWFKDETLGNVINDLFPHNMDMEVVRDFQDKHNPESCFVNIFMCALISNLRKEPLLSRNVDFLCKLHVFSTSNLAWLWWNKTALSRSTYIQNFNSSATLLGDSISQMKSILSHSVPAFVVEQLRFSNISTEKRIMLNLISMYDSYMNLKHDSKSDISSRLKRLRNNMIEEWKDIETIISKMDRC